VETRTPPLICVKPLASAARECVLHDAGFSFPHLQEAWAMSDLSEPVGTSTTTFSHVKPGDTPWRSDGLRDFFLYRDLGVAAATGGRVIAHLVKANMAPEKGTGWHRHEADFQIVLMTKGWAKFMYEDKITLVEAGDCVHQRPGIVHYLFDYSPDMEYLEIVSPADFKSIDMPPACADVPIPTPWA